MKKPKGPPICGGTLTYESIAGTRIYREVGGHHRFTARCDKCGMATENDGRASLCTRTVKGPGADAPERFSRSIVVARRNKETWTLTLECGHYAEELVRQKRGTTGKNDSDFKPPPTRMRCSECERRNAAEPTLF